SRAIFAGAVSSWTKPVTLRSHAVTPSRAGVGSSWTKTNVASDRWSRITGSGRTPCASVFAAASGALGSSALSDGLRPERALSQGTQASCFERGLRPPRRSRDHAHELVIAHRM